MLKNMKYRGERYLKAIFLKYYGNRTLKIKDINLTVDFSDAGGRIYDSSWTHEEYESPLYDEIESCWNPRLVIDIGANYGFTGLISAKKFPDANVVMVEASPKLCSFIQHNFEANNILDYEVVNSICGSSEDNDSQFSLNPSFSGDNRVIGEKGWKTVSVPTKSINAIIEESYISGNVYIKIDTQGFEERVFNGAEKFLDTHNNWLIKTEYAPHWLRSQGTDPLVFLRSLILNYAVIEAPARSHFNRNNLQRLFHEPLAIDECEEFLSHVQNLDDNNLGWCDLFIKPKG